jgi:hypothetical protein
MTTILTATDWGNFFNLRAHRDAQPEFQELAFEMLAAYDKSDPQWRGDGGWHLPFADKYLDTGVSQENLVKIVTARCARVSYLNFEGDFAFEKDFALHDSLSKSGHWSPFEHAAYVHPSPPASNFTGWFQYRKMFQNENQKVLDTKRLLSTRS